jgi:hypothetical protein
MFIRVSWDRYDGMSVYPATEGEEARWEGERVVEVSDEEYRRYREAQRVVGRFEDSLFHHHFEQDKRQADLYYVESLKTNEEITEAYVEAVKRRLGLSP